MESNRTSNSIVDRLISIRTCRTHDKPVDQRSSKQSKWVCPYCEIARLKDILADVAPASKLYRQLLVDAMNGTAIKDCNCKVCMEVRDRFEALEKLPDDVKPAQCTCKAISGPWVAGVEMDVNCPLHGFLVSVPRSGEHG